jgi:hypothetical protein
MTMMASIDLIEGRVIFIYVRYNKTSKVKCAISIVARENSKA